MELMPYLTMTFLLLWVKQQGDIVAQLTTSNEFMPCSLMLMSSMFKGITDITCLREQIQLSSFAQIAYPPAGGMNWPRCLCEPGYIPVQFASN